MTRGKGRNEVKDKGRGRNGGAPGGMLVRKESLMGDKTSYKEPKDISGALVSGWTEQGRREKTPSIHEKMR